MKKLLIVILVLVGIVFARQRSESWIVYNTRITSNLTLSVPYLNSGLIVQGLGTSVNVYLTRTGATSMNYVTVLSNTSTDFYPINLVSGKTVMLSSVVSGSLVQYIWYSNKE